MVLKKIFFNHSEGCNCLEDTSTILTTIGNISPPLNNTFILFPEKIRYFCNLKVGTVDYHNLCCSSQNGITYVCGYYVKQNFFKNIVVIPTCLNYAYDQKQLDQFLFI